MSFFKQRVILKTKLPPAQVLEKLHGLIETDEPGILDNIARVYARLGNEKFYTHYAEERDDEKWYYGRIKGHTFTLRRRYAYDYLITTRIKRIKRPMMGAERSNTEIRGVVQREIHGSSIALTIIHKLHAVFLILAFFFLALAGVVGGMYTGFNEGFSEDLLIAIAIMVLIVLFSSYAAIRLRSVERKRIIRDLEALLKDSVTA